MFIALFDKTFLLKNYTKLKHKSNQTQLPEPDSTVAAAPGSGQNLDRRLVPGTGPTRSRSAGSPLLLVLLAANDFQIFFRFRLGAECGQLDIDCGRGRCGQFRGRVVAGPGAGEATPQVRSSLLRQRLCRGHDDSAGSEPVTGTSGAGGGRVVVRRPQ